MAIELIINGKTLELDGKAKIKYTKQISDIFNIAKVNASYTNSFNAPKTPHNAKILDFLGLVGASSEIPYQKTPVTLRENGIELIKNGWLEVKETSDYYKINIIDGAIDFFKQIENLTLSDIDLSKLDHIKNPTTIRNSYTNQYYRYILGDYGGRKHAEFNHFYTEYLVPSARYKYIIEQIFSYFGWQASGVYKNYNTYKNGWITYPKAIEETEGVFEEVGDFKKYATNLISGLDSEIKVWSFKNFNNTFLSEQNGHIKVQQTNKYRIKIKAKGYVHYKTGVNYNFPVYPSFTEDGFMVTNTGVEKQFEGMINANENIFFLFFSHPNLADYIHIDYFEVTIYRNKLTEVSFTKELKSIKITDIFNDFLRRYALTPIFDNEKRRITFYTLAERLNTNNALDWSDKLVGRDKETYLYGSYGQNNYFRHKYNDENQSFNDGVLRIDNKNLPSEKTLFQSPFYTFENTYVQVLGLWTPFYPIWETEIKEMSEGQLKPEYKSLDGRFYFVITQNRTLPGGITFRSEKKPEKWSHTSGSVSVVSHIFTTFKELVVDNYADYKKILNQCKVHTFTMALSIVDIVNLDFTKPIYIQQEASYYLLNKVEYQNGDLSKVEAVRVK